MNTFCNTKTLILPKTNTKHKKQSFISFSVLSVFLFISLITFPDIARNAVTEAVNACAIKIVPVLFPFAVSGALLTDLGASIAPVKPIRNIFSKISGISGEGLSAFVFGSVFGLPLGGRYAAELYKSGRISKDECQRLIGISMNSGIGFTVIGIGRGMFGSTALGWLIYLCQILSALVVGGIFKSKDTRCSTPPARSNKTDISFSKMAVDAIKEGLNTTLTVCAFTVFFSILLASLSAIVSMLELPQALSLLIACFAEISCACRALSIAPLNAQTVKIMLFFAFGFSGLSAHMQVSAFCCGTDICISKFLKMKLLQGVICATIGSVVIICFPNIL